MTIRRAAGKATLGNADPAVIVKLAHHEAQLEGLGQRMSGVESILSSMNNKLDQAISAIARTDARPQWDLQKLLQSATYGSALVGAFVASIVYITNASFSSEVQRIQVELNGTNARTALFNTEIKERLDGKSADWEKRMMNMRERLMNLEKYLMNQSNSPKSGGLEPQMYFPPDDGPPPQSSRYRDERKL